MKYKYHIKEVGMIPPPYGGVSVYLKRLIEKLTLDGFLVGGYYIGPNPPSKCNTALFDNWSWFETKYYPIKIFKYLYQLKDYAIIHSHMGFEAMIYMWTLKKILGKKLVITVHNSMIENYYQETNKVNRLFLRLLANDKNVTWILVCNEAKMQLELLPFSIQGTKYVIPAYIPEVITLNSLTPSLGNYIKTHNKNIVFYGHSFMTNKGDDVYGYMEMIQIYSRLLNKAPQTGLIYCITNLDDMQKLKIIQQAAKDLDIYDKIFWQLGALESLHPIWHEADVYVRPTATDGDSLSVREAIECGMQVVASDVVKRPNECLVYKKGDIDDALDKLLIALKQDKKFINADIMYYNQVKNIYQSILSNL